MAGRCTSAYHLAQFPPWRARVPDLSKITCIEDLRAVAQRRVPRMFYDYAD